MNEAEHREEGPALKKQKRIGVENTDEEVKSTICKTEDDALEKFFLSLQNEIKLENDELDAEINNALLNLSEYDETKTTTNKKNNNTTNGTSTGVSGTTTSSPEDLSPFDSPRAMTSSSESSLEDELFKSSGSESTKIEQPTANIDTVVNIKQSMKDTSRLLSTFTTLKTTYLKLCKEFNYLLTKFNDNEKIKIELIHENNELRNLLTQIIKERELERKSKSVTPPQNLHY